MMILQRISGWGFEDDDLLIRCSDSNLELDKNQIDTKFVRTNYSHSQFNGDSFIRLQKEKDYFYYKMILRHHDR